LIQVKDTTPGRLHRVADTEDAMTSMVSHGDAGFFARVAERLEGLFGAARNRLRLYDELARMGDREVADLGVSRVELEALAQAGGRPRRLMQAMMARVGVRQSDLKWVPGLTREVERTCGLCAEKRRCRRWLRAAQPSGSHRSFCPNAASFDRALRGSV
jgi:uncharacterized protein YjiS (DUF1127 family)